MAVIVNTQSGNWSSPSTWAVVSNAGWTAAAATQESATSNSTTAFSGPATGTTIAAATTIDAILIKIQTRSTTTGGTFSVRLFNVTAGSAVAGTTVTVNVNDLPVASTNQTWLTFKFSAPITTIAGNSYRVEIQSSVSNAVTVNRRSATASDWTFGLRTTTQQVPAAGDQVLVQGEYLAPGSNNSYTVTMDVTSGVTIGTSTTGQRALEVSALGTLAWAVAPSSVYNMTLNGDVTINIDGTMTIGTQASPMPASSSALLLFNCTSNIQYGLVPRGGSFVSHGATKTTKAYLAASAVGGATSITTSVATGWASGDQLAIATTTRNIADCEQVTMTGAASGTTVPVSALAAQHDGSLVANSARAEIINLNRNVVIRGASAALQTYINAQAISTMSCAFTEFQWMGSGTSNARGIDINTTTGSQSFVGCSFRNFEVTSSIGFNITSTTPNITIDNCVFYRQASGSISTTTSVTTSTFTINDCWFIGGTSMASTGMLNIRTGVGTFTNINAAGASGYGMLFDGAVVVSPFTASGLISHSNAGSNIGLSNRSELTTSAAQYANLVTYRGAAAGLVISPVSNVLIDTVTSFGNATRGIDIGQAFDVKLCNIQVYGETLFAQPSGVAYSGVSDKIVIENGTVGTIGAHTTADLNDTCTGNQHNVVFQNVTFGSPTLYAGQANNTPRTFTGMARFNGVAGSHRSFLKYGNISSDSTYWQVLSPSVRMSPNSATQKLQGPIKTVAVPSGRRARVSVWVRKSVIGDGTTYNGMEAQLLVLSDAAAGIAADTVIATTTVASNGAFELISGTTAAVTDNVALKFLVQCDGTLGWINVDRWSVEIV